MPLQYIILVDSTPIPEKLVFDSKSDRDEFHLLLDARVAFKAVQRRNKVTIECKSLCAHHCPCGKFSKHQYWSVKHYRKTPPTEVKGAN